MVLTVLLCLSKTSAWLGTLQIFCTSNPCSLSSSWLRHPACLVLAKKAINHLVFVTLGPPCSGFCWVFGLFSRHDWGSKGKNPREEQGWYSLLCLSNQSFHLFISHMFHFHISKYMKQSTHTIWCCMLLTSQRLVHMWDRSPVFFFLASTVASVEVSFSSSKMSTYYLKYTPTHHKFTVDYSPASSVTWVVSWVGGWGGIPQETNSLCARRVDDWGQCKMGEYCFRRLDTCQVHIKMNQLASTISLVYGFVRKS